MRHTHHCKECDTDLAGAIQTDMWWPHRQQEGQDVQSLWYPPKLRTAAASPLLP